MRRPHDWEEAFNDVIEEKETLAHMLLKLVSLWEDEVPKAELENAMTRAKMFVTSQLQQNIH